MRSRFGRVLQLIDINRPLFMMAFGLGLDNHDAASQSDDWRRIDVIWPRD